MKHLIEQERQQVQKAQEAKLHALKVKPFIIDRFIDIEKIPLLRVLIKDILFMYLFTITIYKDYFQLIAGGFLHCHNKVLDFSASVHTVIL